MLTNPKSKSKNPKSKIQNPKSKIPNPKSQIEKGSVEPASQVPVLRSLFAFQRTLETKLFLTNRPVVTDR